MWWRRVVGVARLGMLAPAYWVGYYPDIETVYAQFVERFNVQALCIRKASFNLGFGLFLGKV
jgi:hypothetical protein